MSHAAPPDDEQPILVRSKRLRVDDLGNRLVITKTPRRLAGAVMIPFGLIFSTIPTIMITFLVVEILSDGGPPLLWLMVAFVSLFVFVGLGLVYFGVTQLVNTTSLTVSANELTIVNGPLPVPGNRRVDPARLRQLYIKSQTHTSRNDDGRTTTSVRYSLMAVDDNQTETRLLSAIGEPEDLPYIENRIEQFLGLKDRAVAFEAKG